MCRRSERAIRSRHGLTLAELLMATAVMSIIVGVTGTLALAVREGWQYGAGRADVAQQARVVLDRITRRVTTAHASASHPGVGVVSTTVGSYTFPDTLVIWSPTGTPVNAQGPPKVNECVIYCPDPANPAQFLEITAPTDSRDLPLDSQLDTATIRNLVEGLKTATSSRKVILTKLLRTASTTISTGGTTPQGSGSTLRGAVRFVRELRPSASEWSQYLAGTRTWQNVSWPQDWRGTTTGLRQTWLKIELQFTPPVSQTSPDAAPPETVGVLGSAALYYEVSR